MHAHNWIEFGLQTTHFENVPNSKRKHRHVQRLRCECGHQGFRYIGSRVVYTWSPSDVDE